MAAAQSSCVVPSCKRCKSNVVNGVKCKNCENIYHVSCAKLCNNVNFINNSEISCCIIEKICEGDQAFFDAIEELTSDNKKVDIHIFHYILKQKDIIIQELRDKIVLLNDQMQLLQKASLVKEKNFHSHDQKTHNIKDKEINPVPYKNKDKNQPTNKNNVNNVDQTKRGDGKITKAEMSLGIMQVETENTLNKYINLTSEDTSPQTLSKPIQSFDNDWKQVIRKKRNRQIIVGNNKDSNNVKGVPKSAVLHVYRLDKGTTSEVLTSLLKENFPEVECEKINAKHPDSYSSFKVKILETNFRKAMDPELWPYGACISRFLEMGKKVIGSVK